MPLPLSLTVSIILFPTFFVVTETWGSKHDDNCDVARCTKCGGQRLSCDCKNGDGDSDIWSGLWPGVMECYKNKLICYDTCRYPDNGKELGWCFDLNKWALMNMSNQNS